MNEARAELVTKRFNLPVTQRFSTPATVTRRYFIPGITRRFQMHIVSTQEVKPPGIRINSRFAEAFTVLDGPLGNTSGEADVYACRDENSGRLVAIKLYRYHFRPKKEVIQQLQGLVHPNLVTIKDSGQWRGQFYEVMELYEEGVLSEQMPFNEPQLTQYLGGIISGINYCHQQDIIHRDIKPNNLFFQDNQRQNVLIGDFGISSYLENENTSVRVTTTAAHMTLDYAAPELLDGHAVGQKTDYYALGITLIHLLLGESPFTGLSSNDILVAHLRGRIPQLADLQSDGLISEEFQQLLTGLLLYEARNRWGYREVMSWLQGKPVKLKTSTLFKTKHPYPGYQQAGNPVELAAVLHRFDAERQLFRGDIRRWVSDHFDNELAEKIAVLEERYTEYPSKAIIKLRYLLDPEQPLLIDDKPIKSIAELLPVLIKSPESLYPSYRNEEIAAWIEAGNLADERTAELLTQLESIRKRLPYNKKAAMFGLLYTLDPHHTLQLGKHFIKHPGEIKPLYKQQQAIATALQTLIFNRRLEEWIRAAQFENWQRDVAFLESCRAHYLGNQSVGTQCALWYFYPERPFSFAGRKTTKPTILALLIDQYDKHQQTALNLLEKGWIRAWLVGTGKIKPDTEFDQLMNDDMLNQKEKLEIMLRMMNPEFKPPKVTVDQAIINFGVLGEEQERIRNLIVSNISRGELSGDISLERFGQGISINKFNLEGNETVVAISVNSLGLAPGYYNNKIKLITNGGNETIKISFMVKEQTDDSSWWQKLLS